MLDLLEQSVLKQKQAAAVALQIFFQKPVYKPYDEVADGKVTTFVSKA